MTDRAYVVIDAPSPLGLWESGVERLPEALKAHGLLERLPALQGARLLPPDYSAERDRGTGLLNGPAIASYSTRLAAALAGEWDRGTIPLVLGGDCSILIGVMLGLKARGRYGLFFMDGHADYYAPHQSPTGQVADMDLAVVTGASHPLLADIDGLSPYVRPQDAVVFGFRDEALALGEGSQDVRNSGMDVRSLTDIRRRGFSASLDEALGRLVAPPLEGFFLHFDADVLDDAIMPAVDYRMEDGLSFDDAAEVLSTACATGRLMGVSVTIFNPSLDQNGSIARGLADCLVAGLAADLVPR
jgi:arginase